MLKLPDEFRHTQDINRFHLALSVHPKCTEKYAHFNPPALLHTSPLKDFPLGLIRLTLLHKLTCDLQEEKKKETQCA